MKNQNLTLWLRHSMPLFPSYLYKSYLDDEGTKSSMLASFTGDAMNCHPSLFLLVHSSGLEMFITNVAETSSLFWNTCAPSLMMNASTSVLVKSPLTVKAAPSLSVNVLPSLMVNELTVILPLAMVALASMMTCESLAFGSRLAAQLSVFDQSPSLTNIL